MSFIDELRRRNVVKVAVLYVVASWLVLQVTDVLTSLLPVPDWTGPFVFVLLAIGFPLALVFSWIYELTPEGLKREQEVDRSNSISASTGKRINLAILALLVLAIAVVVAEWIFSPRVSVSTGEDSVTLAVLPFDNRSARPEDAYFVEGVHEELLIRLSRVAGWRVISRTSVEAVRDLDLSIPQIGEMLGATHIIEGSVQRSADRVRLSIQLIDVASDTHIWAPDPYDRDLLPENLFAIQSDIAVGVADSLKMVLAEEERDYIATVGTGDLEAYDKYLQGRQLLRQREQDTVDRAVALFRQAVDADPDFAAAWAGLAVGYRLLAFHTGTSGDDLPARAESAARKSVRLDQNSSEAWASLANALEWQGDYEGAEEAYRRSVRLNGNYSDARMWFAAFLSDTGRSDEAVGHFEQALTVDPLHPAVRLNFAETMLNLGRSAEAEELLDEQIATFRDRSLNYAIAASYTARFFGDYSRAIELAEQGVSIDPECLCGPFLGSLFVDLGDEALSRRWLESVPSNSSNLLKSQAAVYRAFMGLRAADYRVAYASAMEAYEIGHPWSMGGALRVLRDVDMRNGDYEKALARYERHYSGLSNGGFAVTDKSHSSVASDIVGLLMQTDRESEARALAAQILAFSQNYDVRVSDVGLARARAHMILGEHGRAKAELGNLVDLGWRRYWWYTFDVDPAFEPLRSDAEFIALRDRVAADMASKYQSIRRSSQD